MMMIMMIPYCYWDQIGSKEILTFCAMMTKAWNGEGEIGLFVVDPHVVIGEKKEQKWTKMRMEKGKEKV